MKAFFIGLIFLIAVALFSGIGLLLYPLLLALAIMLRVAIAFLLVIFAIWLLGKFIIFVWEKLR